MFKGKDKLIPIIAMVVLLIGTISVIYVNAIEVDKETISIDGNEFTIEQLFNNCEVVTIQTDDGEKTGISLNDLYESYILSCKTCDSFTIKASDGYQQTVDLNTFKSGVLTENKRVFFPDTAHALWVRDVIEIEVK
jgi:hypothetical protein